MAKVAECRRTNSLCLGVLHVVLVVCLFNQVKSIDIQLQAPKSTVLDSQNITLISTQFQASTYRYLIVQTVSQKMNLSISFNSKFAFDSRINGTARGLVYMLKGGESHIDTYLLSTSGRTISQVISIPFLRTDPIPGGCCITCSFDNDPNIYVKKELLTIRLNFERANVYYDPGTRPTSCDGGSFSTFNNLEYELYMYQLTENDFTEDDLFNGIWKMSHPRNIKKYGKLITKIKKAAHSIFLLQMIPRQGIVYNVLVKDIVQGSEAAYVPTFAYDCDINNIATCKSFGSATSVIYAVFVGIIGLGLCFLGHKYFKCELFIAGAITGFFITYILVLRFANVNYIAHMVSSTIAGIALAMLILILYLETKKFHIFLLNNALLIGTIVSCSIAFSPVGHLKTFSNNSIFLPTFLSIAFAIPIPLLFFPRFTSILFSSLIGGYMTIMSISVFMHANAQYIVIEFMLRAGIPSFADSYMHVPFQQNEFILCGVWGILLCAGAVCQYILTRKEIFPPKPTRGRGSYRSRVLSWYRRRRGVTERLFDERTPLLPNENIERRYDVNNQATQERRARVNGRVV